MDPINITYCQVPSLGSGKAERSREEGRCDPTHGGGNFVLA